MIWNRRGRLRYLFVPTLPILVGLIAFAAFTTFASAVVFLSIFSIVAYLSLQYWERHHSAEAFDSKLTDERISQAADDWVRLMQEVNRQD